MNSLPAAIKHVEVNPTGACAGYMVKKSANTPLWDCPACGATYDAEQLYYLSGDMISDSYTADYLDELRQDDIKDCWQLTFK